MDCSGKNHYPTSFLTQHVVVVNINGSQAHFPGSLIVELDSRQRITKYRQTIVLPAAVQNCEFFTQNCGRWCFVNKNTSVRVFLQMG